MTRLRVKAAVIALAMLTSIQCPAYAAKTVANESMPSAAPTISSATPKSAAATPFIVEDFKVPTVVETPNFKIMPLGPNLVKIDFDAYMSSINHLQKTFTRSTTWPHKDISDADAMRDMETEQARFSKRESFAYAVLTPDGSRERGSVYVRPSSVKGYDAEVSMWVTKAEYDAGFDAELYVWVKRWLQTDWPFENVAYPGRAIEWNAWDSAVAASATGTPGQ
ncbi:hypothetical protein FHS92_002657 [Sphingobium subterraneum]|uniref:Twin-arginine translocation pathway signal protein n=2 Tax=Sphingobium subterraneum TaxID=627688 RepID=A0A841J2G7_9SPHN|nr:hypothetical protein [Sphingobium subterraneum]